MVSRHFWIGYLQLITTDRSTYELYYKYLTWYFESAATKAISYNLLNVINSYKKRDETKKNEKQKQVLFMLREIHFGQCRANCSSISTKYLLKRTEKRRDLIFQNTNQDVKRFAYLFPMFYSYSRQVFFFLARNDYSYGSDWLWLWAAVFAAVFERLPNRKFANILAPLELCHFMFE